MAIPQLDNSQPILSPVTVNSDAQGYDEFARTLGSLSEKTAEEGISLEQKESDTQYMSSMANADQVANSARQLLLEHPENAAKIAQDTAYTIGTIKDTTKVNEYDRSRLERGTQRISDAVNLDATRTAVDQSRLGAAFTHYSNWTSQLQVYKDALLNDPDQAQKLHDSMLGSLSGLVATRVLSPAQAANGLDDMQSVVQLAHDHYQVYGNQNSTAQDYHTVKANPLDSSSGKDNTGDPVNASTGWLIDHYNNDKSLQGAMADISKGQLPNPETFDSLDANARQHAMLAIQGTTIAKGAINSGEQFPVIEKAFNDLSQKGEILNYRDKATRNYLGQYINNLKNGNYLDVIQQTPQGNSIFQNFNARNAAIMGLTVDNNQKFQMLLQNKNKMVDESVAYGQGHNIPSQYIQPIPKAEVATVSNAFNNGQDPTAVISTMNQYTKPNQLYLANAMKNPEQRMVTSAVGLADKGIITPQEQIDFIAANQNGALGEAQAPNKGRSFLNKDIDNATNDKTMMTRIAGNLSVPMKIIANSYDYENAQTLQNSMLKTTLNYAKYLAQKNGDIGVNSYKNYVDQASKIYKNAYQQQSGTNWIINPQQLPLPMTNPELDVLAQHITNKGYDVLRGSSSKQQADRAFGSNPLRMVLSPTNDLQAVDGNGKVYYTEPLSTGVIASAQVEAKKNKEQRKKERPSFYDFATHHWQP